MLRLGVQVSIAGKIYHSIDRAQRLGCNAMQIFARSPRQFRHSSLKKKDIQEFTKRAKKAGIKTLVIHTPYTLNLGAAKSFVYHISIKEFIQDIKEASLLGAQYIVIHTGSYRGEESIGLDRIVSALKIVLEETAEYSIGILLENTSGAGSALGYTFYHHGYILKKLRKNRRVGLCVDTAHAWCAGYAINTAEGVNTFINEIDAQVGKERLRLIHLNDTLDELGSKKDRHYHIGKGRIGREGFRLLLTHPFLRRLPFILETPKQSEDDDAANLSCVRTLYGDEVHKGN